MTQNPSDNLPQDLSNISQAPVPLVPRTKLSSGLKRSQPNQTPTETSNEAHPKSTTAPPEQQNHHLNSDGVDSKLVDQTKTQIRALVQEITALAKSDCLAEDFYEGFLTRTTSALASMGGAIWISDSADEPLKLHYQINLKQTKIATDKKAQASHGQLLKKLADQGEPALIGPDSGSDEESAGNPTEYLLVLGPLKVDNQTIGLVEIFQRPGAGPTTQRGYLRFVMQMSDIASEFLCNQRIRSFAQQQQMWQQLEQFMRLIHQGLNTEQTAFTLANEGRRLLDCDRVSVAIGTGRNCRVKAVSGLDSIERRSEQVKKLGSLASTVLKAGQPIWYTGDNELPPQIEKKIHAYVDKSHTRMLSILPLFEARSYGTDNNSQSGPNPAPKPLGALIIEQLKDSRITPALKNRARLVVEHGETALTNAQEHNSIFLMPVWKSLGKLTSAFRGNNRGKTLFGIVLLAGISAFLALFPYSFGLGAKGSLIPESQFEVFAKINGTIEELAVSDDGNTIVTKGQVLATMKNSDIELAISDIVGRIASAQVEIDNSQALLNQGGRNDLLTRVEHAELDTKMKQATQLKKSLHDELLIREEEQALLAIKSPSSGRVINWNVRQSLMHRPILEGQKLMTIVPPDTQWLIELEMPERRMKHLIQAARKAKENGEKPLTVTFGLMSNPGTKYEGELLRIDKKLDVYSDEGNTALVRVTFANDSIDQELLRSETRVNAKVQCGTRSIGYVIFHELIETVQSSMMFWF